MTIKKKMLLSMVKNLPPTIDVEDFIYQLYVCQNIAAGEEDIRKGRVIPHDKVVREAARWFR